MNVARRSRDLKARLLNIRIGPGAATLSADVKCINLDFAFRNNEGHFGARKLWRNYLPRLKYYNPAISMIVNRHHDQAGHSTMTVLFANPMGSSSTTASSAISSADSLTKSPGEDTWERTEIIDMKHKHESEILQRLFEVTKAVPYEQSVEETAQLEEIAHDRRRRDRARERQSRMNERRKYEKDLLQQARESAP